MAKRTEGFDEAILQYAKEEFKNKGYENASLRTIAGNASVSTSMIYTRYRDKEGLFKALVSPAAEQLLTYMEVYLGNFEQLDSEIQEHQRQSYSSRGLQGFLDIFYDNFDEFRLMTTGSTNGLYRYYLDKIIDLDVQCTLNFLKLTENPAFKEGRITEGFIHILSASYYTGIFEIAVHNMSRETGEAYAEELTRFYNNGWMSYL